MRLLTPPAPREFVCLICGCQDTNPRMLSFDSPMTFLPYPPKRDSLLCVARHKAVTRTWDAPSLRHYAPGSLSLGSNLQEFVSPGPASRRVVPWGTVSSWVKGADFTFCLTSQGLCFINTAARTLSL